MNDAFFEPLDGLVAACAATRPCPEFSDESWLRLGLQRVLESVASGRAFLQEHGPRFADAPKRANYFAALATPRRLEVLREASGELLRRGEFGDRLAGLPGLDNYECFAADGHWHKAATHDPRHNGVKMAVGHVFGLNLRGHQLHHLVAAEGFHEHDMSMLKRVKPKGLRHGVPKGRRVLIIYDKAGIDFPYWQRCRRECAIYFLSRPKEGMIFGWEEDRTIAADPHNAGILADQWVLTRQGERVRLIRYREPAGGQIFDFLTNEPDLQPGILAELYRRRWEIEKVFDEIKNKLHERKAWGSSLVAKAAQAQFIALAHNLMLLYERRLAEKHGVRNDAEDRRRQQRQGEASRLARSYGRVLPRALQRARQATQRSVKFVRWLRHALRVNLTEMAAAARLRALYATL